MQHATSKEQRRAACGERSRRATDLLFRIRIDGRDAFLYIVLEHQSTVDRWMAWRQMRSVVLIWDKGDDPKRTKLPFILPIVVSQASQRWSAPTDVKDLVDLPDVPELEGKVPSLSYLLLDLRAMSDGQILAFAATASLRLFLLILRNIHNPKLKDLLQEWHEVVGQILDEPNGLRLIELLLTYMAKAVPDMTQDTLRQFGQMAGLDPEIVEGSLAWKWLQEGREEGVARVMRQFQRRLGRELAAKECALLRDRLNTAGDEVADIVLDFTREELEAWLAESIAR